MTTSIATTLVCSALVFSVVSTWTILKLLSNFSEENFFKVSLVATTIAITMTVVWPLVVKYSAWYFLIAFVLAPLAYLYSQGLVKFWAALLKVDETPSRTSSSSGSDFDVFVGFLLVALSAAFCAIFVATASMHFGLVAGLVSLFIGPVLVPAWMLGGLIALVGTVIKGYRLGDKWTSALVARIAN